MLILGIESSCDETGVALISDKEGLLADALHTQIDMHRAYGGVVPELASRDHIRRAVALADEVLAKAGKRREDLDGIAVTEGPGLAGALLVGASVAHAIAWALEIPVIGIHHLEGHLLAARLADPKPEFPFLALLVSGGHTQIMRVESFGRYEMLGQTLDDAAGEAFDKCAKVMGLGYPGGPVIDRLAREGDPEAFRFAHPHVDGFDFSFSGLKTSFLYTLRDAVADDPDFIDRHKADLCASLQHTIVEILLKQLVRAAKEYDIRDIAVAGGVSANSGLRNGVVEEGRRRGWRTFVPEFRFTTDNAAMIAVAGYYHYLHGDFSSLDVSPVARIEELM